MTPTHCEAGPDRKRRSKNRPRPRRESGRCGGEKVVHCRNLSFADPVLHVENIVRINRMAKDDGLDCLDLLAETPAIVRGLIRGLSHDDARWKPAPDRFSVAEVLAHLSHSETHCYRMRVDRFLNEALPEFEEDNAQMYLDLYRDADADDSFAHFAEQRETSIAFLHTLPRSAGGRKAMHKVIGEFTLQQMLHEWAMHDLGHIRQIAELVRARKHWQAAGRLGEFYQLRP